MKDEESRTPSSSAAAGGRRRSPVGGRIINGFKLWLLAAILLLALWSVFAASFSLKGLFGRCGGGLCYLSGGGDDLDILEVEEREKVVRMMWDVYARAAAGRGAEVRLPRFWREAFEAAYEFLASDSQEVRNAAVSDIAKMSLTLHSVNLERLSHQFLKNVGTRGGKSGSKKGT